MGFLPPSSSEQCLKLWAAMPPTILAYCGGSSKRDRAYVGMFREGRAGLRAVSSDDIDHAFWQVLRRSVRVPD